MTVNPLPPQAYTKETLQKAYTWLLNQGSSVKEMATSQEILISLYLKAQRNGEAALETPSIQNFKQELKSLASMMGELQTPQSSAPGFASTAQSTSNGQVQNQIHRNTYLAPKTEQKTEQTSQSTASIAPTTSGYKLDEQSLQAVQDIKHSLNLSTDSEALRALISLGYRQFKKI